MDQVWLVLYHFEMYLKTRTIKCNQMATKMYKCINYMQVTKIQQLLVWKYQYPFNTWVSKYVAVISVCFHRNCSVRFDFVQLFAI
jgi:hypothetical protein